MQLLYHVKVFLTTPVLMVMTASAIEEFEFNSALVCTGSYGTVLEHHASVQSAMVCAILCSNNPNCKSGLFNLGTKSCKLNMEPWFTYQTTGCLPEEKYFERLDIPYCSPQDGCTRPPGGIRLCDGGGAGICDRSQGRIELLHEGTWESVCDDFWGDGGRPAHEYFAGENANVTCRMFGYTTGTTKTSAYFGTGTGTYLLDNVSCDGDEASLYDCPALPFGYNNCVANEEVGVSCS